MIIKGGIPLVFLIVTTVTVTNPSFTFTSIKELTLSSLYVIVQFFVFSRRAAESTEFGAE